MTENNLKLEDLINLDGLEKPQEGLKVPLWGSSEKVRNLGDFISDFTDKVEDQQDVKAGEVTELLESMKKALTKELSPENAAKLLETLKKRFENKQKPYKSAEGVNWKNVQAKLEASPEKLWSLNEMERTGGEPDLMEYDKKTGEYIFMDCSAESPTGRRNCVYDREGEIQLKKDFPHETCDGNAVSTAALMGVDVLSESQYRELQTKGEFDKTTWSWLKTPVDKRKSGVALYGDRFGDGVHVEGVSPRNHDGVGAFRSALRVK